MSLYHRLAGTKYAAVDAELEVPKISIHAFTSALHEFSLGHINGLDLLAMFDISEDDEITEAVWLRGKLNSAGDKKQFIRVLKDVLYLAEGGYAYKTEAAFVARINEEL